jgi:dCMP deaminase
MSRPSFEKIYLDLAFKLAERSTCYRLKVGTVITSTDFRKVLAVGYNGNATGLHNGCDREEVGNCGCLHSEENAVINCDAPRGMEKVVFVTHLPCVQCAKRLINLGNVRKIFYATDYRIRDSLKLLESVGIEIAQLSLTELPEMVATVVKTGAVPQSDAVTPNTVTQ